MIRLLFALTLLLAFTPISNGARNPVHGLRTQLGSGVDIEVHALFDQAPRRGFAPVRVTISNHSGQEHTWRFAFSSVGQDERRDSLSFETALTVPHGEARKFDIMVPIVRYGRFSWISADVYGYGLDPAERKLSLPSSHFYHGSPMPAAVAFSPAIASANRSKLEEAGGRGGGSQINGTAFDLALVPPDWRAFAGFDAVWITDREWIGLGAAERLGLLDWVAMGGRLYVAREEGDNYPLPGLENLGPATPVERGSGTVQVRTRSGDDLDIDDTRVEILSRLRSNHDALETSYRRSTWALLAKLPEVQLRKGLFIGFLFVFAMVVGPLNLFLLARGSQRHRLFWTTPAISFGASLMLFLLILFQDGIGGSGHQLSLWAHLPGENKAAVTQEQASRTALLAKRQFAVDESLALSTLNVQALASLSGAKLTAGHRSFSGDWFRNRATQGHLLEAVTATRWRLELTAPAGPGTAPSLLSTFPFSLDSVFYLDPDGNWWKMTGLQAGQPSRFEPVEAAEFEREWRSYLGDAGAIIQRRARNLADQHGYFYAFSNNSPESMWKTLESVDWKSRRSLHIGPALHPQP